MSNVVVCRGRRSKQLEWVDHKTSVVIDTVELKKQLNINNAKLMLSIRDSIMIKALRYGRNVILVGDFAHIEQIERIDEVLDAQGNIDGKKYTYKVKDF